MSDIRFVEWFLFRDQEMYRLSAFGSDTLEVSEQEGAKPSLMLVEDIARSQLDALVAERLQAKKTQGFVEEPPLRQVLWMYGGDLSPEDRAGWQEAVVEHLALPLDGVAHVAHHELLGNHLCFFIHAGDSVVRQIAACLEKLGWGERPYHVGTWNGTDYLDGDGVRIGGLSRDAVRRRSIPDGEHFRCGTIGEKQALLGVRGTQAVAYFFTPEGGLAGARRGPAHELAEWQAELTPGAISLVPFLDVEMGVGLREEGEDFVLLFGDEYVNGVILRIARTRFLGPVPSSGERLTIPYEAGGDRFDCVGRCRKLQVMAFVSGADPIHPETGRPEYPNPGDPEWPKKKRWYGLVHLFDEEGNHAQTIALLGGTSFDGRDAACDRAAALTRQVLDQLGPIDFQSIQVRRFSVESEGYLFGLCDEDGAVMLWPNDVMFHADGSYST